MRKRGENQDLLKGYQVHYAIIESQHQKEKVAAMQSELDAAQTRLSAGKDSFAPLEQKYVNM